MNLWQYMVAEASGAGKTNGANPVWFDFAQKDAAPKETEQQKLQKTNVWDYANAMQAGAYMG